MNVRVVAFRLACMLGAVVFLAGCATGSMGSLQAKDLIKDGGGVVKLGDGYSFTEGPVADAKGNVYFADIPNERILKWSLDGEITVYREKSGGANGLYFDRNGNLLACEGGARRISQDDMKGNISALAESYGGKKLNATNDLWVDPKNGVYFTDPYYGPNEDALEMDGMHVYYITPDRKNLIRVCDDLKKPNGIIGTPDGKTLYVADPGDSKTWRYKIKKDGTLTDKTLFCESGSDGMTIDEHGNVYLTTDKVDVYGPSGDTIAAIVVPERPANVTFAGKDRRTLFITARTSVYAIEMNVRGARTPVWK